MEEEAAGPRGEIGELDPWQLAAAGHGAARARLAGLAGLGAVAGVATRRTPAWTAVRTGLDSNDLNGVVATTTAVPGAGELADLDSWWGPVPACWLAPAADPDVTAALLAAGWTSERSGRWAGRRVDATVAASPDVRRVDSAADLDRWLEVAQDCGWFDPDERDGYRRLAGSDGLVRWVVVDGGPGGEVGGMATAWRDGAVVELVDVAVSAGARRRGVGTRLVETVLAWAGPGRRVVAAPSPDGWALMATFGFDLVPVTPDVCFYRAPA